MPKIGAHVSASVSLELAFDRAVKIGAECTQIFISPPQSWNHTAHPEEEIAAYRSKLKSTGIGPNFNHGIYLINLATEKLDNLQKDISWLIYSLKMGKQLGLTGTIFHLGSHKGKGFETVEKQVCEALEAVLKDSPDDIYLILENSASKGNTLGGKFYELGRLLKAIQDPRLKVCIDTQHAFASGYDLRIKEGLDKMIEELDKEVSLENVAAFHTNDSKMEFDSGRDRHENIGEGFIGREGFQSLVQHPALQDIPMILEVPGFDDNGPDKENIDLMKSFRM
jgi:deoxyribonuclease IV